MRNTIGKLLVIFAVLILLAVFACVFLRMIHSDKEKEV